MVIHVIYILHDHFWFLSESTSCLAHGCAWLARGLAIAGEKWYGFSKSGTAFQKVVRLFRVSAIAVAGLSYPVTR